MMFRKELEEVINRHSRENGSDTPDFILAEYLDDCLATFNKIYAKRARWFGDYSKKPTEQIDMPLPANKTFEYKSRPKKIEAYCWTVEEAAGPAPSWMIEALNAEWGTEGSVRRAADTGGQPQLEIVTLEGTMKANVGDFIIQGLQLELYPCKPDIFMQSYEAVDY